MAAKRVLENMLYLKNITKVCSANLWSKRRKVEAVIVFWIKSTNVCSSEMRSKMGNGMAVIINKRFY